VGRWKQHGSDSKRFFSLKFMGHLLAGEFNLTKAADEADGGSISKSKGWECNEI
jgi:hypothetical protein